MSYAVTCRSSTPACRAPEALATSAAVAFIHIPPMTLPKMCKESHHIRALKIETFDKEKVVSSSRARERSRMGIRRSFKILIRPGLPEPGRSSIGSTKENRP